MKKINRIINIALISIPIWVFLREDCTWPLSNSTLRPPSQFSQLTRGDDILVQQLIVEPIRTEEILEGLNASDRERLIDKAVAALNQQFKKPADKEDFKTGLGNYLTTLKILRIKGILRGLIVYPVIGIDVVPAQVGTVIGINNRRTYEFIKEDIRQNPHLYPGINLYTVVRHLTYISGVDILDIDSVAKAMPNHNYHIALIFKGMYFLGSYTFNPDWVSEASPEEFFTRYLHPLCDRMLKAGDDIILFNKDIKFAGFFINSGEYENIESGMRGNETESLSRQPYHDQWGLCSDVLILGNKCVVLRKIKKEGIGEIKGNSGYINTSI